MKLDLQISKKFCNRASGAVEEFVFSVVDLDLAETYPLNYLCILPKNLDRNYNSANAFIKIFKEKGPQVATKLLNDALNQADSQKLRNEIDRRLKALKPKPSARCAACNSVFEPRKFGKHFQNLCSRCRNKGGPS